MVKCCTICGETKPIELFHNFNRGRYGRRSECAACSCRRASERYKITRGEKFDVGELTLGCRHCGEQFTYMKTTGKRRYYCGDRCRMLAGEAKKLDRAAVIVRECACGSRDVAKVGKPVCQNCKIDKRDPVKARAKERRRTLRLYSLTPTRFDELLAKQNGICAVCGIDNPGTKAWAIDHDHTCCSGKGSCGKCVRGLLCQNCNLMIGHAIDSPRILRWAADYVESYRATAGTSLSIKRYEAEKALRLLSGGASKIPEEKEVS